MLSRYYMIEDDEVVNILEIDPDVFPQPAMLALQYRDMRYPGCKVAVNVMENTGVFS